MPALRTRSHRTSILTRKRIDNCEASAGPGRQGAVQRASQGLPRRRAAACDQARRRGCRAPTSGRVAPPAAGRAAAADAEGSAAVRRGAGRDSGSTTRPSAPPAAATARLSAPPGVPTGHERRLRAAPRPSARRCPALAAIGPEWWPVRLGRDDRRAASRYGEDSRAGPSTRRADRGLIDQVVETSAVLPMDAQAFRR